MRFINWDDGYFFDDPNLRWGNPSYLLEPGDPGYTPPPLTTPKPKKKMPKSNYIKANDDEFAAQLNTYKNNIGGYATTLGVLPAQVTAQAGDSAYFAYVLTCHDIAAQLAQQWTVRKDIIRKGGTPPPAGAPVAPVFPAAVTAVAPGVEPRFRALVQQNRTSANYNEGIGEALGTEGEEQTGPDLMTLQPEIKAQAAGSEVKISWGWQGFAAFLDMIELQVDRGSGWQMLAMDTTPNYNDTQPFPATATRWKYRAIFRVGDARVGLWSNEVSVNVGG
jgi:hypothetical protein